jgi:hypothetical protein
MRIISPAPYDAGTAEREAAIALVEDMAGGQGITPGADVRVGAGGRSRTDTLSPELNFESSASTSSATPANHRRPAAARCARMRLAAAT